MRGFLSIAAIVVVTLVLLPAQSLAVAAGWPLARRLPSLYHRLCTAILGVRITVVGDPVPSRPLLIVSNHVSWLDICVITALMPAVFVAKREVATWPVIGVLARLQRSIFVDRGRRHRTADATAEIGRRLAGGDAVVLFAEGTTSDGSHVQPFRSALIGAARDAIAAAAHHGADPEVVIQPLAIAYTAVHGIPLGRASRATVAWYGSASLLPHLWQLVAHGAVDVTVSWGRALRYGAASDRKAAARLLQARVRAMTVAAARGGADAPNEAARTVADESAVVDECAVDRGAVAVPQPPPVAGGRVAIGG